jgi:hypothetical protein
MACGMHILAISPHETVLPTLQKLGTPLFTRLLSLSRSPDPSRLPQPVRPDTPPSRPHIPSRQPYPTRQE